MRGRISSIKEGQISGGPESFSLTSASYAIGDGDAQPVEDGYSLTNLDPKVIQVLRVICNIHNADAGILTPMWDGRITVYDLTNNRMVGTVRDGKTAPPYGDLSMQQLLSLGLITKPVNLRINIMANQDYNAPQPDVSLWKIRA